MSDGVVIGLVIGVSICMLILIIVFIKTIKKEKIQAKEEHLMLSNDSLSYDLIKKFIQTKIDKEQKNSLFTVLSVNIDQFSEVSDNYLEKEIESLISEIHHHIKNILPRGSKIGYGFREENILIYLPNIYPEDQITNLTKQIKKASELKVQIFQDIFIEKTVTISYVTYPMHGQTAETLIEALKIAIYVAEYSGGNTIKPYTKDMNRSKEYINFYYELKQAIRKREFYFLFQPIMNIQENNILGFESLLRWQHPIKGTQTPDQFITMLENSGDIDWIGLWGLENIVKTSVEFKRTLPKDFLWHINISLRQLVSINVVSSFQKIVQKYKINPQYIVLELLNFQNAMIQEDVIKTILKLKNIGFKIAVDIINADFQVLTKIEQYQIDIIKISREFHTTKTNVTKEQFMIALKKLAETKKINVVFEGVENQEMAEKILSQNYYLAQGYHYSKPLTKEETLEYIQKHESK